MNFETVWNRIMQLEGEPFFTVTKKEFIYRIVGNAVVPEHTGFPISRNQFLKAFELGPLNNPGQISKHVMGSSYVFAILTDSRIRK